MLRNTPICLLCLSECDPNAYVTSCNHFFCARCAGRLGARGVAPDPVRCPMCKKSCQLTSIRAPKVQLSMQDPLQLIAMLAAGQRRQQELMQRMSEAVGRLKDETKTARRRVEEAESTLSRVRVEHQAQMQEAQRYYQHQHQQQQQHPYPPRPPPQQELQSFYHHPPGTPQGQPTAFARAPSGGPLANMLHSGAADAGRADSTSLAAAAAATSTAGGGGTQLYSSTAPERSWPVTPSHLSLSATPPPLGWSTTSGVLMPQQPSHRLSEGGSAGNRTGAGEAQRTPNRATSTPGGTQKSMRLFTPLDRSTATPDLLWPR